MYIIADIFYGILLTLLAVGGSMLWVCCGVYALKMFNKTKPTTNKSEKELWKEDQSRASIFVILGPIALLSILLYKIFH